LLPPPSNKIQNGDILVSANPGSHGKMAIKMEKGRERKGRERGERDSDSERKKRKKKRKNEINK